jgi:hypothetical protein
VFIGPNSTKNSTGSHSNSGDIDVGNDNRTDVSFVNEDRVYTDSAGKLYLTSYNDRSDTVPAGAAFSIAWTGMDVADQAIHEIGHTFGLSHVNDYGGTVSQVPDAMGYRYTTVGIQLKNWALDVSFVNQPLYLYNSDTKMTDYAHTQNSFVVMNTWASGAVVPNSGGASAMLSAAPVPRTSPAPVAAVGYVNPMTVAIDVLGLSGKVPVRLAPTTTVRTTAKSATTAAPRIESNPSRPILASIAAIDSFFKDFDPLDLLMPAALR